MRLGVITDATCDLPAEHIARYGIQLLPVTLQLGDGAVLDERDPSVTMHFYRNGLTAAGAARAAPITPEALRRCLLEKRVLQYDYVFCITPDAAQNSLHEHATGAAYSILDDYPVLRRRAGLRLPFALQVLDSQTQSAGLGLLVSEAGRMADAGLTPTDIGVRLKALRSQIRSYLLPADSRRLGTNPWQVGWTTARLERACGLQPMLMHRAGENAVVTRRFRRGGAVAPVFAFAAEQIRQGLECPRMVIGYGGDPRDIASLPGYDRLADVARRYDVELLPAAMSATTALTLGAGGINIAFAPRG